MIKNIIKLDSYFYTTTLPKHNQSIKIINTYKRLTSSLKISLKVYKIQIFIKFKFLNFRYLSKYLNKYKIIQKWAQ